MKKNEFLEACDLLANDSGLLSFDIISDNGQSITVIGTVTKCTDTNVVIKVTPSNTNKGYSLSTVISVNEYNDDTVHTIPEPTVATTDKPVVLTVPEPAIPVTAKPLITVPKTTASIVSKPDAPAVSAMNPRTPEDYKEATAAFLKSETSIARSADQIDNIYKGAIKNHSLKEKKGRIISELNGFYKKYGKEPIARIFVAQWFEKIEEYKEAVSIYKSCNDETSAILCSIKSKDDTLYSRVPAKEIPSDDNAGQASSTESEGHLYYGHITTWNQEQLFGFIKLDEAFAGRSSLFFHLSSMLDDELREYLYKHALNKKIAVSFKLGDNGKPDPVATEITPTDNQYALDTDDGKIKQGFIDYYNTHDDYGQIRCGNESFGFKSKSIIDPYLDYYFDNSFRISDVDVYFVCESNNNKPVVSRMMCTPTGRSMILSEFSSIPNTQKFDDAIKSKTPDELLSPSQQHTPALPLPQYRAIPMWNENDNHVSSAIPIQPSIPRVYSEDNPLKSRVLFAPKEKDPCQKGLNCLRFNPERAKELFLDALQQNKRIDTALPSLVNALNMLEGDQCDFALPIIDYYGDNIPQEKLINLRISLLQKAKRYDQLISAVDNILPFTYNNSKRMHFTYMKAQALSRIGEYQKSIPVYEAYKKIAATTQKQSDIINADKGIAYCYYLMGEVNRAKDIARSVLKYNANDSVALAIINDQIEAAKQETEEEIFTSSISTDREIKGYLRDKIDSLSLEASAASTDIKKYIKDGRIIGNSSDVSSKFGFYIDTKIKRMPAEAKGNGWLFLAKIVENILSSSEESEEILEKNKITVQTLNLYAGRSMLAHGDYLALSQSNKLDTLRFYYSQTLNLITEDQDDATNAFNRMISSFYVARDELVSIVQNPKKTENNYYQLTESKANDSLKSLFIQSFSLDNRCNAKMKRVLVNLFKNKAENKAKVLSFDGLLCDDSTIENQDSYYEKWLYLREEYTKWLGELVSELSNIVTSLQSSAYVNNHLKRIKGILNEGKLLELDTQYLDEYHSILQKLTNTLVLNDFDRREDTYNSIISMSQTLIRKINESPTALSYDYIRNAIEAVENYCIELLNSLYSMHIPQLAINQTRNSYLQGNSTEFGFSISNGENLQPADILTVDFPKDINGITFESDKNLEKIQRVKSGDTVDGMRKIYISDEYKLSYVEFEVIVTYSYHQSSDEQVEKELRQQFHIDLQGENDFTDIPNKYRSIAEGTAVTGDMFIGRDSEINDVVTMLKNGSEMLSHSGIVLYGQKRAGKSSILANLQKAIEEKYGKDTYLFFDIGSMGEIIPHSISNILATIISVIGRQLRKNYRAIYSRLCEEGIDFKEQTQLIQDNPANSSNYFKECFAEIMDCLEKMGENNRFIPMFLVDEFTYVYEWIKDDSEATIKDFPHFWKAFIANNKICSIVIGQDNMPVFTHMPAYANDFACMKMWQVSFLKEAGARELICAPMTDEHGNIHIDKPAVDMIIKLTAGSAYLIVFICNKMVDYMNQKRIDKMTCLTLKQFLRELLNTYEDWDNLFESQFVDPSRVNDSDIVAQDNMQLLSYIAVHHDEMYFTKKEELFSQMLHKQSVELLDELVRRNVLIYNEQKDAYKIKVDLMRLNLQYKNKGEFELND